MAILHQNGKIVSHLVDGVHKLADHCCCDCFPACADGRTLSVSIEGIAARQEVGSPYFYGDCLTDGTATVDLTALNGSYLLTRFVGGNFISAGACDHITSPCDPASISGSGFPLTAIVESSVVNAKTFLSWLEVNLDCDRETGQMYIASCLFVLQCAIYQSVPSPYVCSLLYYLMESGGQYYPVVGSEDPIDTVKACKSGGSFLGHMRTAVKWPLLSVIPAGPGPLAGCNIIELDTSIWTDGFIIATLNDP